jgi:hypothetical protein
MSDFDGGESQIQIGASNQAL